MCLRDDCCRRFEPAWERHRLTLGTQKRLRGSEVSLSALRTLAALFHQLRFRQFKRFSLGYACRHRRATFPKLPRYHRCVDRLPRCAGPLAVLFKALKEPCDGVSIAAATVLAVCDTRRIARHRVFKGSAGRGKTSMGGVEGFKLHAIINSKGELIRLTRTSGHVDDRNPMPTRCKGLFGHLFADTGSLAQGLTKELAGQAIQLITPLKKNRKTVPRTAFEKALLRRRSLLETVFDDLKTLCQLEHTRHRSVSNFVVNLMAGILTYCLSDHKPTLKLMRVNALAMP